MLITCLFDNTKLSIGVRNSGTQAKISVSARLEYGGNNSGIQEAINEVCDLLAKQMISHWLFASHMFGLGMLQCLVE